MICCVALVSCNTKRYEVSLNHVFLGNPGTGKTTVAKLYGRVLKAAGFLSDGGFELKQPNDLVGSHVGETMKKTGSLIDRCLKGKVLIIDEAYALGNSTYGHEALDTIVSKVHGAPGEDIAVVMIGYEKQMLQMFRSPKVNAGLARRFHLEHPFRFEDFDDSTLARVVIAEAKKCKISLPRLPQPPPPPPPFHTVTHTTHTYTHTTHSTLTFVVTHCVELISFSDSLQSRANSRVYSL
jgi:Holliday junction resolvasome RuvABC ATP-dependent DNA helicase subunit